jgi:hypothetical protein
VNSQFSVQFNNVCLLYIRDKRKHTKRISTIIATTISMGWLYERFFYQFSFRKGKLSKWNTITLSLVSNIIFISHAVWTYEFTLGYFSGARVVKSVNLCSYLTTIVYMLSFLFVIVFCPFCLLLYVVLSVCYCMLSFLFVIVFCPFCLLLYFVLSVCYCML